MKLPRCKSESLPKDAVDWERHRVPKEEPKERKVPGLMLPPLEILTRTHRHPHTEKMQHTWWAWITTHRTTRPQGPRGQPRMGSEGPEVSAGRRKNLSTCSVWRLPGRGAAKSLQSCPTLCDPTDGSPPGSPIPGILQARTLEWVAISFSNAWKWKVKVKSLSRVRLLATPWTAAYQVPPPMGFSRQEYWSGVPLPSPFIP